VFSPVHVWHKVVMNTEGQAQAMKDGLICQVATSAARLALNPANTEPREFFFLPRGTVRICPPACGFAHTSWLVKLPAIQKRSFFIPEPPAGFGTALAKRRPRL